jgi:hypothetical protein
VLIFVLVAMVSGYLALCDYELSQTQTDILTLAAKRHQPDLLSPDPVFGDERLWRFHTPSFQSILEMALVPTGYRHLPLPLIILVPLTTLVYLCGMYALLYRQCRSWSVSAFVAVLSMTVVYALGRSFWGVGSLNSIIPATLYRSVIPLIVLAYLRYEKQWRLVLVFGFIGLMGNLHLVTAMNLTLVLLAVLLVRTRFHPRCWPLVGACATAALVAASPYLGYFMALRAELEAAGRWPVEAATVVAALRLMEDRLLYPALLRQLLYWLGLVGVLLVPAAAVLARVERFRVRDLSVWVSFAVAALVVALGLQGLSQIVGTAMDQPPPIIDFVEASSLAMLPLYVLVAQALTNLFRLVRHHRALLRWGLAIFTALWMIPSENLRVARHWALAQATQFMDEADKPRSVLRNARQRQEWQEIEAIGDWAQDNSSERAIFITRNRSFRRLGRRAIVGGREDVKFLYYLAPWRLEPFVDTLERQAQLLRPPAGQADGEAIEAFARNLADQTPYNRADQWYVILEASYAPEASGWLESVESPAWGQRYRLYRLK